jgi:hypothetical protein
MRFASPFSVYEQTIQLSSMLLFSLSLPARTPTTFDLFLPLRLPLRHECVVKNSSLLLSCCLFMRKTIVAFGCLLATEEKGQGAEQLLVYCCALTVLLFGIISW